MKLLLLALVSIFFVACNEGGGGGYQPYFYPDNQDYSKHVTGPTFYTADGAREWVNSQIGSRSSGYDYEIIVNGDTIR